MLVWSEFFLCFIKKEKHSIVDQSKCHCLSENNSNKNVAIVFSVFRNRWLSTKISKITCNLSAYWEKNLRGSIHHLEPLSIRLSVRDLSAYWEKNLCGSIHHLESPSMRLSVRLKLRLFSYNLKYIVLKCLVNTSCYRLKDILIWFFTYIIKNILYI